MPRRRSQSRALLLGVIAVTLAFGILLGLSWAVGNDKIEASNLGDRELEVGNADRLADRVASDGPFILADLSPDRDRVVYLQHVGADHDEGWFTILAGTERCPVEWTGDAFRDCRGTYDEDGAGLTRYETAVRNGKVVVDLRTELP